MNSNAGKKPEADPALAAEIEKLESQVSENPRSPLFSRLAGLYNQAGEYEKSEKILNEGIRNYPEYTTAYLVLVDAYVGRKDLEKARDTLEKLLLINPSSFKAHRLLADISMENEHFDVALSHYRMANRFDPLNRDIIQLIKEIRDSAVAQASEKTKKKEEKKELHRQVKEASELDVIEPASSPEEMEKYKALLDDSEGVEEAMAAAAEETKIEMEPEESGESKETAAPITEKAAADAGVMSGSFTDENGIIYFIDDDEVSFEQYKKRLELVKDGKARIVGKDEFNQKVRGAGTKAAEPGKKELVDSATPPDAEFAAVDEEPVDETGRLEAEISAEVEQAGEVAIDDDDPNALLEVIEMSYRDYLDLLDEEEDLLEALFPEDHPRDDYLETTGYEGILEEETALDQSADEELTYQEYVSQLTDPTDRAEAELGIDKGIGYDEYVSTLTDDSEKADAATLAVSEDDDRPVTYREYLASTENEVVSYSDFAAEQILEQPEMGVLPAVEMVTPSAEAEKEPDEKESEDISIEAFEEVEKSAEPLTEETDSIELTRKPAQEVIEPSVEEIPEEVSATEKMPVEDTTATGEDLTVDDIEGDVSEVVEELTEEIDADKASLEMADAFLVQGKFGKAYQVYQILKKSQADDPKVDRKLAELRKLSVWSRQLAG